MTDFQSKFDGKRMDHRAQFFQIIIPLAREILNGPGGMKFKVNFFQHAKNLGWIPKTTRTKKAALQLLVELGKQGFGYVPKGTIKEALRASKTKARKAS